MLKYTLAQVDYDCYYKWPSYCQPIALEAEVRIPRVAL